MTVVPGQGVFLITERAVRVLEGPTIEMIAPLIDGTRTDREIAAAVADTVPLEKTLFLLRQLRANKDVYDSDSATPDREEAFWDEVAGNADLALDAVGSGKIALEILDDAAADGLADVLRSEGVRVVDGENRPHMTIVITTDYLHPRLGQIDSIFRSKGHPWLLAKVQGTILHVGPLFDGSGVGCWQCMSQRISMSDNNRCYDYISKQLGSGPLPVTRGDLQTTVQLGERLVALEALKWLAGVRPPEPLSVLTLNVADTASAERHVLRRRPQCPGCGDSSLMGQQMDQPVAIRYRATHFSSEGGYHFQSTESFLAEYSHLVSPITGVTPYLHGLENVPGGVHTYTSGSNHSCTVGTLHGLQSNLRSLNGGKGSTELQAKASALAEFLERHCSTFQGDERRISRTWSEISSRAVHPDVLTQYSLRQYAHRQEWNATRPSYQSIGVPFDESKPTDWSPVWSLTEQRHKYLPSSSLFFNYPDHGSDEPYISANSNGNAAGASIEDAIVQGGFELIERDSIAQWWYNRLRVPGIDLGSFNDPWIKQFQENYAGLEREVWALDLTCDLGIPTFVALSRRVNMKHEKIIMGFGAHFNAHTALLRALSEMNRFLPAAINSDVNSPAGDSDRHRWLQTARLQDHTYLVPNHTEQLTDAQTYTDLSSGDLLVDVLHLKSLIEDQGMEMLVLNLTRPDIRLPVVKVIVPGMRHFWARFAPGRLYDVPVKLGRLKHPTAEEDLNPFPMFL
ncbi:TOMM precursor leader peptide-binding protein [Streptomyces virginiae]|uniref:TOMM precursor leader peptide-binding protein n=1 Tax=Streptomyces virginiae TaxID=1961 RepID=UPI00200EBE55|nr:TOMM precursor leader peptide-binding protein [Streptomyces virginiae]